MRILIAEDNTVTRTRLREILLSEPGWEVKESTDGKDAWSLLDEGYPAQLLIADFQMPVWGAVPLVKKLRTDSRFENLPVYVAGSFRDKFELEREKDLPVTGRLLKPFHGERVLDELRIFAEELARKDEEARKKREEEEARLQAIAEAEAARLEALAQAEAKRLAEEEEARQKAQAEREAKAKALEAEQKAKAEAVALEEEKIAQAARVKALEFELQEKELQAKLQEEAAQAAATPKKLLEDPAQIMEKLGIGPIQYIQMLDQMLVELSSGVEELRGLMLTGHTIVARDRLQSMKRECLMFGATYFVQAIEGHLLSESGIDRVTSLEHFDNELRRLKEARAAIRLFGEQQEILTPLENEQREIVETTITTVTDETTISTTQSITQSFTAITPKPLPEVLPIATSATATRVNPLFEAENINRVQGFGPEPIAGYDRPSMNSGGLPTLTSALPELMPLESSPSSETAETPTMITSPELQPTDAPPPGVEQLLPAAELEKLQSVISVAAEAGYQLSSLQAMRAVLRAVDPSTVAAVEFYNVLMEDYQATQGV